jgi:hypothetical protein
MSDYRDVQVDAIYAELDRLRAENEALLGMLASIRSDRSELDRERAKVAAVLKVHFPGGGPVESPLTFCDGCGDEWPCVTARDLGVEEA